MHRARAGNVLYLLDGREPRLHDTRGQAAIGVVYHPRWESQRNHAATRLAGRYNTSLSIEATRGPATAPLRATRQWRAARDLSLDHVGGSEACPDEAAALH